MDKTIRSLLTRFLFTRLLVNTSHRMVYPLLPVLSIYLGVTMQEYSFALAFRAFIGIFSPVILFLVVRKGTMSGIHNGLLIFGAGLLFFAVFPTFYAFILFLSFTTVGKYILDPSMQTHITTISPPEKRGLVIGVLEMGWSLAFLLGVPLIVFTIAKTNQFQPVMFVLVGLTILALISLNITMRGKQHQSAELNSASLDEVFQTIKSWPAMLGISIGLLMSAANETINVVFSPWLEDHFEASLIAIGGATIVIGLSELFGEGLVSKTADKLGNHNAVGIGLFFCIVFSLLLPIIAGSSIQMAQVGLFLFYLAFEFTLVSSISMMTGIKSASKLTLMSLNIAGFSAGRMIGAFLAPMAYGMSIWGNIGLAVVLNVIGIIFLIILRKNTAHFA